MKTFLRSFVSTILINGLLLSSISFAQEETPKAKSLKDIEQESIRILRVLEENGHNFEDLEGKRLSAKDLVEKDHDDIVVNLPEENKLSRDIRYRLKIDRKDLVKDLKFSLSMAAISKYSDKMYNAFKLNFDLKKERPVEINNKIDRSVKNLLEKLKTLKLSQATTKSNRFPSSDSQHNMRKGLAIFAGLFLVSAITMKLMNSSSRVLSKIGVYSGITIATGVLLGMLYIVGSYVFCAFHIAFTNREYECSHPL